MSLDDITARAASLVLDQEEIRRYGRHLTLPEVGIEGQRRLKAARVLMIGAGGLGSPLGLYLAAAGVGSLGIVDDDRVDLSNLQRQVLYGQSDLGRPKAEAALERLRDVNPHIDVHTHPVRLTAANAGRIIAGYDLVVDGSDNFATRYLVNDACVFAGKPDVWGAILRFEGQVSVFWADRGPCYRCLFPEPPPPGAVPSCAEGGVLGILPGIIGALQANEAVKLILGRGEPLVGRFLTFDALRLRFRELRLRKDPDCPVCGDEPTIRELVDLTAVCEVPSATTASAATAEGPVDPMPATPDDLPADLPFEIDVGTLKSWLDHGRRVTLLDVREPLEHQIARIEGSELIPMRQVPQRLDDLDPAALTVVFCHHGPRSSQVVAYLRQQGFDRVSNLGGGIDAWSLDIDPSVPRY